MTKQATDHQSNLRHEGRTVVGLLATAHRTALGLNDQPNAVGEAVGRSTGPS